MIFNHIERFLLKFASLLILFSASLFSFYIYIFGKTSAGGGFQAGALLASSITIYQILNNQKIISNANLENIIAIGLIMYALTGLLAILFGGVIFQYKAFHKFYGHIIGSFLVETSVFCVVTASMLIIGNSLGKCNENDSSSNE